MIQAWMIAVNNMDSAQYQELVRKVEPRVGWCAAVGTALFLLGAAIALCNPAGDKPGLYLAIAGLGFWSLSIGLLCFLRECQKRAWKCEQSGRANPPI